MTFSYSYENEPEIYKVRLLINDVDSNSPVFQDAEIEAFLDLYDGATLLAAAEAIDTNADNEVLASKVLKTQDLTTDGAKLADALRKRAASLREQYEATDGGYFEIVDMVDPFAIELAEG